MIKFYKCSKDKVYVYCTDDLRELVVWACNNNFGWCELHRGKKMAHIDIPPEGWKELRERAGCKPVTSEEFVRDAFLLMRQPMPEGVKEGVACSGLALNMEVIENECGRTG